MKRLVLNPAFIVSTPPAPAAGHNSKGHPDWFKYGPGETAPGVITRERGDIPNCVPPEYHLVGKWHECTEAELAAIRAWEWDNRAMFEKMKEDEMKAYLHGPKRRSNERPKLPYNGALVPKVF